MLGTLWTVPGYGVSIRYWLAILANDWPDSWLAIANLRRLMAKHSIQGQDYRTNLALTGDGLCVYDIERIATCE
jgi:hypothetical protein